jgi:D-alanyl-D-alanine carboxypeptidase
LVTRVRAAGALSAGFALIALVPAAGAAPAGPADRALDRALRKVVQAPGGPPGVISVVRRGGRSFVHRAGVADTRSKRPWRQFDHMLLASTSKAFNGAVALSLVRRGVLDLDDTIGERLPSLPAAWAGVTVGQALHHTSGLPDFTTARWQADLNADPLRRFTPPELVAYAANEPPLFPPGSAYNYSNTDNIVVGLMVEAATGRSYERLLRSHVFSPLGLPGTSLPGGARLPRPFAHGYILDPPQPAEDVSEAVSMSALWASGRTAVDLGRARAVHPRLRERAAVRPRPAACAAALGRGPLRADRARHELRRTGAVPLSHELRDRLWTHGQLPGHYAVRGGQLRRPSLGDGVR